MCLAGTGQAIPGSFRQNRTELAARELGFAHLLGSPTACQNLDEDARPAWTTLLLPGKRGIISAVTWKDTVDKEWTNQ
jgi:hypothetical protein